MFQHYALSSCALTCALLSDAELRSRTSRASCPREARARPAGSPRGPWARRRSRESGEAPDKSVCLSFQRPVRSKSVRAASAAPSARPLVRDRWVAPGMGRRLADRPADRPATSPALSQKCRNFCACRLKGYKVPRNSNRAAEGVVP